MNHLCVVLMLTWFSNGHVTSSAIPIDNHSLGPLLDVDGQRIDLLIELHESEDSWLQKVHMMVSHDNQRTQPPIGSIAGIPIISTTAPLTLSPALPTLATGTPTAAITLSGLSPNMRSCRPDFVQVGNQCYYLGSTEASFDEASKACQSLGADLFHPTNEEENLRLSRYLRETPNDLRSWWIGVTDRDKEGQWVWAHDNTSLGYTDWLHGEPNNSGGIEDCAIYSRSVDYKWNDVPCDKEFYYLCQQPSLNADHE